MNKSIYILLFLTLGRLSAQTKKTESIYFELDKYTLNQIESQRMEKVFKSIDFSRYTSVHLYGYCDDRGSTAYNDELSKKRVDFIQKILISKGLEQEKIFVTEGRGEVILETDAQNDLEGIRYKNRRVDVIFENEDEAYIFPEVPKSGDVVILKGVTFDMGSSQLSFNAKQELNKIVPLLKKHKTIRFEIKGHVCCTSRKFTDAIDDETQDRDLSENRAKNVFMYLRSKGISPYRMSYKGYGNRFPLGKDEAKNRRVELYITQV